VMQDMRFGIDRHTALTNMAERVDIPELRGFVAALAQADALGLPISDTLRIQSEDLRDKRQKAAEEQAMKLPVKILLPMVVCILPVLFITILGPAAIRIFEELG
jgi:tight adherence protein C